MVSSGSTWLKDCTSNLSRVSVNCPEIALNIAAYLGRSHTGSVEKIHPKKHKQNLLNKAKNLVSLGLTPANCTSLQLRFNHPYLLGVQLPTATINVPLNNHLQTQDLDTMTELVLQEARMKFEPRWIRWNSIRTVFSILTTALLIILCIRALIDKSDIPHSQLAH